MAITIAKDISVENEATFGASRAGTQSRLHVQQANITTDTNKQLVDDTPANAKGYDRITRTTTKIDGDINLYASIRNLHHSLEWISGIAGTTTASGTSALVVTYNQNTSGSPLTKTINIDRETSQEKFSGVGAKSLELKTKDNKTEISLGVIGKTRSAGTSVAYAVGETITPYNFADWTVKLGNGASFASSGVSVLPVSEWSLKYDNGLDGSYLSGSRDISRLDNAIPKLSGKFKIFHEYSAFTDQMVGSTDYSIRFEGTLPPEQGLIAGATPYFTRIDVPRIQATSSVRNYEVANLAVEEVEWTAMFEAGTSTLWTPSITMGFNNI